MVVTRNGQNLGHAREAVVLGTKVVKERAPVPRLNTAGEIVTNLGRLKMFRNVQLILVHVSLLVYC